MEDGHIYEYELIQKIIARSGYISPTTSEPISQFGYLFLENRFVKFDYVD